MSLTATERKKLRSLANQAKKLERAAKKADEEKLNSL